MIYYKFDVLKKLDSVGYTYTKLRDEQILGESTMTRLRNNIIVAGKTLDTLCELLNMQPGDILGYKKE